MRDYVDFEIRFKELMKNRESDKDCELIKDCPAILSVVMNIAADRHSDGVVKMLMNSAVSYFVLPTDIVSEKEFGIKGYMDDFYVCLYVLHELLNYDKKLGSYLISKYWKIAESYESYIPDKYYAIIQRLGEKATSDVISSSGLYFIKEFISLKKMPRTYSEKKIRELQNKLYYMFYLLFGRNLDSNSRREFDSQFFGTEEFFEFTKKIELLSESDDSFKPANKEVNRMFDIEEEIKKARAKRLLK
jgi:uncharacterized membrane protein YkvA (DUF1232 family)